MYGNATLPEGEIENLNSVAYAFTECLFSVKKDSVDTKTLKTLAPNEDPKEWNAIYTKNGTQSIMSSYQLLDVCVEASRHVYCLCVCESIYSDWKTLEDTYLFIVQLEMEKKENWEVVSSELLGTAREADVSVTRDDLNNAVKFVPREGGEQS